MTKAAAQKRTIAWQLVPISTTPVLARRFTSQQFPRSLPVTLLDESNTSVSFLHGYAMHAKSGAKASARLRNFVKRQTAFSAKLTRKHGHQRGKIGN